MSVNRSCLHQQPSQDDQAIQIIEVRPLGQKRILDTTFQKLLSGQISGVLSLSCPRESHWSWWSHFTQVISNEILLSPWSFVWKRQV